jgi:rhodanese-related sulfurtransferase
MFFSRSVVKFMTQTKVDVFAVSQMLKSFQTSSQIRFIDVRDRSEIVEHGAIPGFMNVPLSKLTVRHFLNSKKIILTCRSGRRAVKAIEKAAELGLDISEMIVVSLD